MKKTKTFKVAAVSSNTNSFGLKSMILVAKDGEAWQVAANSINVKKKGDTITVDASKPFDLEFSARSFEIPERLHPDCPPSAVKEVWKD